MQKIHLSIPEDRLIEVRSSHPLDFSEILAKSYIPEATISRNITRQPDIVVEFSKSENKDLVVSEEGVLIKENWTGSFPLDFYHLLYSVARTIFLKQELYPVHAALAGEVLLVGHSGTGKTSVALNLLDKYGFEIFSGNKTLVSIADGTFTAVGGTRTITVPRQYKSRYTAESTEVLEYADRAAFALDNNRATSDIRSIVLVRLNDGVEEYIEIHKPSSVHKLYPYFLDVVNAHTILCGETKIYPNNSPIAAQEKLTLQLAKALTKIPVYHISGSLEFITDSISKI